MTFPDPVPKTDRRIRSRPGAAAGPARTLRSAARKAATVADRENDINRQSQSLGYRDAGVDIDAGAALVEAIKPAVRSTRRSGADGEVGGFAGAFDLKAAGFSDPVLLAATDGVGTKLKVAIAAGRHDTVGIDLVAMCVNDLVVQGAEPLFFLDYYATGKLSVAQGKEIVDGIATGCRLAGCALIGGETAEMPGMYAEGDYDLAGFAVGAAERGGLLDGSAIAPGDRILGMASSGVHSNGFSLVRRIVELSGLAYDAPAPFPGPDGAAAGSLGEALLAPTRIYVPACLALARAGQARAFAHITGGGLSENLPRVLPAGCGARLDGARWQPPAVFDWLARTGGVAREEMARTFNCGIGMVAICSAEDAPRALELLAEAGEEAMDIGEVVADETQTVRIEGLALP